MKRSTTTDITHLHCWHNTLRCLITSLPHYITARLSPLILVLVVGGLAAPVAVVIVAEKKVLALLLVPRVHDTIDSHIVACALILLPLTIVIHNKLADYADLAVAL